MVSWGKTADGYVLPSIKLAVTGAGWLSGAAVGSWTLDRELVASTIPGNIRERNGLSIGAASVMVRPAVRATPWSKTAASKVTTGLPASLYAQASDGTTRALGAWLTDETDGSISAEEVSVDLLEASFAGRDLPQSLPAYGLTPFTPEWPVDPVWPISRLLDQAGFSALPQPDPTTTILAVPMDGAIHPTMMLPAGAYTLSGEIVGGWQPLTADGGVAGGSGSGLTAVANTGPLPISDRLRVGGVNEVTFTLDVVGTVYLLDVAQGYLIRIVNDQATNTYSIAASNNLGAAFGPTHTFAGRQSAVWPDRVQVKIQRAHSFDDWTTIYAAARSGPSAAWSSWSSHTATYTPPGGRTLEIPQVVGGAAIPGVPGIPASPAAGRFASVVVSASIADTEPDPSVWAAPKAVIKPLGGDVGLPFVPAGVDVWQAIQDAASASLAAVIVDLDGMARVLTRDDLAGVGVTAATVDVGAEWEDLNWTLDPEDSADRLEVTYTPPALENANVGSTTIAPEAWSIDEVVKIEAGQTATFQATFDGRAAVGVFGDFLFPTGSPTALWSQYSIMLAFDNPAGTGFPLTGSNSPFAQAVQTSATTATVTVRNRHNAPIYLVDGNGDPCLSVKAHTVATYSTPRVVERGAAADVAKRPLQVDLTPWVQTEAHATDIANYLWDRISGVGMWKAASVRCRLDWSLDIGQVRSLVHSRTGLDVRVLIAKVHLDGSDSQIAQSLDLVLIPWTYANFAPAWPTQTYAQFSTAQGTRTYVDHAADPLWTGA